MPSHTTFYLPGMDGTGELFYTQAPALQLYGSVETFTLDASQHLSWAELVQQVRDCLDPADPVILCAESFGACLALELACQWPETIQSLVLVNPASSFRRRPWLGWGKWGLPLVPDPVFSWIGEQGLGWLAELSRMHPLDRVRLQMAVQSVPKSAARHRLTLLEHFNCDTLPLEQVRIPTLLVAGGADRLLPSIQEVQHLATRLPCAHIEILPASGHACLLEKEVNLSALMGKFGLLPDYVHQGYSHGSAVPSR